MEQAQGRAAAKRQNAAYLIFLCAVGYFVASRKSGWGVFAAAYPFFSLLARPGVIFLLGRWARRRLRERKGALCAGLGLLLVGYAQKVLVFWAQTLLGQGPVFYPFSTSGVAWAFLTAGTCTLLAGALETHRRSTRRMLAVTVVLGLLGGLLSLFDSFLCLGQTFAYAPFFVLGSRLEDGQLDCWGSDRRWKLPALALLALTGAACLLLRWPLKRLWPLIDGDSWYGACSALDGALLPAGILLRLGWYLLACGLLLALLCLTPGVRLPLFTAQGSRALSGYFWALSLGYLAIAPARGSLTVRALLLTAALLGVAVLVAPSRAAAWVTGWIMEAPLRARAGERAGVPARLGGSSFYRRHRWAIRTTALYTACFIVVMVAYVYPFFSNGKCLIWRTDGMGQQYPMMFYFKESILGMFERLLTTGELSLPAWDFSVGFGMSPLELLWREPFMLLALLGNEETMEAVMNVTVILRLYVCGLSFLWLCATLGKKRTWPVVMGALLYICSGFSIYASGRQPFFVTDLMTYLPVMLVGVERYLRRRRWGVFVAAVFLQLIGGYYTPYINGCLMAVYLLIRLGCQYRRDIRRIAAEIGRLIGLYVWGAALAMGALLPRLLMLSGSARTPSETSLELLYRGSYYEDILTGLPLEFGNVDYWTYISLAGIGWLACILLCLRRRRALLPYQIGLGALSAFVVFPVFGLIFNGFAYTTNRWSFAFPLLVGMILVEMAPEFLRLTRRDRAALLVGTLLYCALVVTHEEGLTKPKLIGLTVLCMTALVVLCMGDFAVSRRLRMGGLAAVTAMTVMVNMAASFLPGLGSYVDTFQDAGKAYEDMSGAVGQALSVLEDDSFYRIAQGHNDDNQSLGLGYYGASTYYSVSPAGVSSYLSDICLAAQLQNFRVAGLDERAVPMTLAAVKYYVSEGETPRIPYGFSLLEELEDGVALYQNDYALPLGYSYDSYITLEEYEQLTPLEKQQVMLTSAVIDAGPEQLAHGEALWQQEKIACEVSGTDGLEIGLENGWMQTTRDSKLRLSFEGQSGCETYLVLDGIRYTKDGANGNCRIACRSEVGEQSAGYVRGSGQSYYFARDALIFHLGYSEEARGSCTLTFEKKVHFSFEDIYVVCVPVEDYGAQASALGEVVLENIVEEQDVISGTFSTDESRLLTFSVPYDEGWSIYVNGEERELLQVNVMYCGVLLEPGEYEIEMRYESRGSTAGALVSAVAALALIPACIVGRRRRR